MKTRNSKDLEKIIASIETYGFSFPFFVWKKGKINYVLDGHGRLKALTKLQEDGVEIPSLPVVYLKCKTEREAKDLLLRMNSNYGKMTRQSVLDFIGEDVDLDLDNFELPSFSLYLKNPFDDIDDSYKKAIEKRDTVSPTTKATRPVIEEDLSEESAEELANNDTFWATEVNNFEIIEDNSEEKHEVLMTLRFNSKEKSLEFMNKYAKILTEEFNCEFI